MPPLAAAACCPGAPHPHMVPTPQPRCPPGVAVTCWCRCCPQRERGLRARPPPAPGTAGAGIGTSRQASARWLFRLHRGSCGAGRELGRGTCPLCPPQHRGSPTGPPGPTTREGLCGAGQGHPIAMDLHPKSARSHSAPRADMLQQGSARLQCCSACSHGALHALHTQHARTLTFVPGTHALCTHLHQHLARACCLGARVPRACTRLAQAHELSLVPCIHTLPEHCAHISAPHAHLLTRVLRLHHCTSNVLPAGPCTCVLLAQAPRSHRGPHCRGCVCKHPRLQRDLPLWGRSGLKIPRRHDPVPVPPTNQLRERPRLHRTTRGLSRPTDGAAPQPAPQHMQLRVPEPRDSLAPEGCGGLWAGGSTGRGVCPAQAGSTHPTDTRPGAPHSAEHPTGGLQHLAALAAPYLRAPLTFPAFGTCQELSAAPCGSLTARRAAAVIALIYLLTAGAEGRRMWHPLPLWGPYGNHLSSFAAPR